MLKLALTAGVTAAVSIAIAASTGLGAATSKVVVLKAGQTATLTSNNFECKVITKTQVACGAKLGPHAIEVYYAPHQLEVLQFGSKPGKAAVLLNVKR